MDKMGLSSAGGHLSNKEASPATLPPHSGPSIFLFINETSNSPAYKHKNRQDIRSHVQKHATRRSKQVNNKETKLLPNIPPLAPQFLGQTHPQILYHDSSCPEYLSTVLRLWAATANIVSLVSGTAILDIEHSTESESPTVVESERAPSGTELKPTLEAIGAGEPLLYCKACGKLVIISRLSPGFHEKGQSMKARISAQKVPWKMAPLDVLGAGRVDPFSCYPVDKPNSIMHELLDHAVTYLFPGLLPDVVHSKVNTVSKAWLAAGLRMPILFHALIFAGSIHLDFLLWSKIFPNSRHALYHKLVVIQKLKEVILGGSAASQDEIILAILVLASHEVMDPDITEGRRNPFNSPLGNAQWLNVYGNFKSVPEHVKAVLELVNLRGGIEKLELLSLAETLIGVDVVSSTNLVSKPALPPLRSNETAIAFVKAWATSPPRSPIQTQASSFWVLRDYGITDAMFQAFDAIGAITIAIDHYLKKKPGGLALGAITRTRTAIQHRSLLLPSAVLETAEELNLRSTTTVYESCRLAALIFGVAVVLPVPNSYNVLQDLVRHLRVSLDPFDIEIRRPMESSRLTLA